MEKAYRVRATRCSHKASREEIYQTLKTITDPLTRSWEKLEKAKKIGIKVNMQMRTDNIQRIGGRRQELVDEDVLHATLRLLRERTDAEIFVLDTSFVPSGDRPGDDFNMRPLFEEFKIPYIEAGDPPFTSYKVPGGGLMFSEYQLSASLGEADAFVSLAKMKSHGFMGITLCLKNLFGLPPIPPHGRLRTYFHHPIRLSYVLPDLGQIANPCLNIIDALTGQSKAEWGGEGRICDALIAGDHVIATDACGTYLMGTDPALDWPHPPYRRDRSPIAVAAENGFGTVNLDDIDFEKDDLEPPLAEFNSRAMNAEEDMVLLRKTACEQALYYRDNQDGFVNQYAGDYIYLQDGDVIWNGPHPDNNTRPTNPNADKKNHCAWLKRVDPEEQEGEHFSVYEQLLAS
ncbi:MAG: DUF362 domain-containing protein [bacterium]|nr:DUF362 domain-containing protein [bacterium]